MFSRSILFALVLGAIQVSAAPGLSLSVTGPESVSDVANLKVVATVTNTGDESLKLLKDPYGPLSTLPTDTFSITNAKGDRPAFTGIKAKYSPEFVATMTDENAFTVLAPGQSVEVEHDLSAAYNFTATGADEYNFEANNRFYFVDEDNKVSTLYASGEALTAKVSGRLGISRAVEPALGKRATYVSCSSARQTALVTAASDAQSYASSSYSYLTSHTSTTTRYATWFGTWTSTRYNTVLSHFQKISSNTFSSYTYDCTCTESGTYAYVYPSNFGRVYLCGAFWNAPATGTDSKAGTLIHESSHFTANGGTNDYAYGQSAAKSLATSNPNNAVMNADNHEYFAENTPVLP